MPESSADTLDLSLLPFWMWDTVNAGQPVEAESSLGITLDSLLPAREAQPALQRPSMFRHHALQVEHTEFGERLYTHEPAWVFVSLVVLTALLCLYYRIRKIRPLALMRAAVDDRALDRLVRDCNLNRGVVMVSMGLLLVGALALPIVRLLEPFAPWWYYVAVAAGGGLLYVLRNGLMRWLGNVFERKQEVSLYITNNYIYHLLEASVLTAGLFLFIYLPTGSIALSLSLGVLLGVACVMRMIRGAKIILMHPNASDFYLFYYLCIVELIPALVPLRLFMSQ